MENLPGSRGESDLPDGENADDIRAENELLRLKLELEFGMDEHSACALSPVEENQWLNHIYNFEKQFKDAKRITVHKRLGSPSYPGVQDLSPEELKSALSRLLADLENHGIGLDCCAEYDDEIIYKFITQELLDQEIDDISIEACMHHFIYEDFHPNHEYDLRRYADEFIELLLRRKLDEFDWHHFADRVAFNDSEYSQEAILAIIESFQQAYGAFEVIFFELLHVKFDLEMGKAEVVAKIRYAGVEDLHHPHDGSVFLNFILEFGAWRIAGFGLPGLGG